MLTPPTASAIRTTNLFFTYDTRWVLEAVNLSIAPQTVNCLIGPNGGGKTTLLKLFLGLLKPNIGTVEVLGSAPQSVRKRLGYTPQHALFDTLFPITAEEVVLMGRLGRHGLFSRYNKADKEAALQALNEVGLVSIKNQRFHTLSGGQRQRVLIARALVGDPEILFLDEPTANVDPAVEHQLLNTLERLSGKMTLVLVSHDLGFVAPIVQNVLCINKTVQLHTTESLSSSLIESTYGHPLKHIHHGPDCSHR